MSRGMLGREVQAKFTTAGALADHYRTVDIGELAYDRMLRDTQYEAQRARSGDTRPMPRW